MRDIELQLRQAAEEIRRKNHNGWGNACEQAADALANALDDLAAERARADAAVAEAAEAWRQVHLLKAETSGPDGFATWKDAATDERVRRVKAEAEAARLRADAERYRKWRREFREGSCGLWNALCEANSDAEHDAAIDAVIDAARGESQ